MGTRTGEDLAVRMTPRPRSFYLWFTGAAILTVAWVTFDVYRRPPEAAPVATAGAWLLLLVGFLGGYKFGGRRSDDPAVGNVRQAPPLLFLVGLVGVAQAFFIGAVLSIGGQLQEVSDGVAVLAACLLMIGVGNDVGGHRRR